MSKNPLLLSSTWILDPPVDVEHHQYILLAFIQKVKDQINDYKLQPALSELVYHCQNIESYLSVRKVIIRKEPALTKKQYDLIDTFENMADDHPNYTDVIKICEWSLPKLRKVMKVCAETWRAIDKQVDIKLVGRPPIQRKNGYLFIKFISNPVIECYKFTYPGKINDGQKYEEPKMVFIKFYEMTNELGYEDFRRDLMIYETKEKEDELLFLSADGMVEYPIKETILPIVQSNISILVKKNY